MFKNLTQRLSQTLKVMQGKNKLTEKNIKDTLKEVRMALLNADVALHVVKDFIGTIKRQAIGKDVSKSLNPGQMFVKIVQQQLTEMMGTKNDALNLSTQPPAVILIAGLQGSGKTTSVAKLANFLKNNHKKKVLITSTDIYRPAAIDQLQTLANDIKVDFFPSSSKQKVNDIALSALDSAKKEHYDVLIIDTAGRLHIDEKMMNEIQELHQITNPIETLFVVDAMTGQDAANTAKYFANVLPLTGIILTKVDGDARGGAALSVRHITGKPIKFIGIGEKTDALEAFHPDRIASRILGMGDILSLIEEVEQKIDQQEANKLAKKLKKGKTFNLNDFSNQLQQIKKMGNFSGIMDKLPIMSGMPQQIDPKTSVQIESIIKSMTPFERLNPELINGSRKKRIALGSGHQLHDINRLLKQHKQMSKMMKKVSQKGGISKLMRGLQGLKNPSMIGINGNRR